MWTLGNIIYPIWGIDKNCIEYISMIMCSHVKNHFYSDLQQHCLLKEEQFVVSKDTIVGVEEVLLLDRL